MNIELELLNINSLMKEIEERTAKIRSKHKNGISCAPERVREYYHNQVKEWTDLNKNKTVLLKTIKSINHE